MLGPRAVEVSVDGGVRLEHARALAEHGATVLVAGSAIFGAPDPAAVVKELRAAAEDRPTG
jgi:ribulose-phosphate 3-epimerase